MFGPDLLVEPVLYEGVLARGVSACGTTWKHAWTDEVFPGITAGAPLKRLPLYLRREKVLPIKA